jgi:cyclic pyranopterin phosphate synthase
MVDVSEKKVTRRSAAATALVTMKPEVLASIGEGRVAKGDVIGVARVAGIAAAKRTAELIPLCHPLVLDQVSVEFEPRPPKELLIRASVRLWGRTGAEMEALTGATVAALTVYDMCKSADRAMVIGPVRLETKSGGKSDTFRAGVEPTG